MNRSTFDPILLWNSLLKFSNHFLFYWRKNYPESFLDFQLIYSHVTNSRLRSIELWIDFTSFLLSESRENSFSLRLLPMKIRILQNVQLKQTLLCNVTVIHHRLLIIKYFHHWMPEMNYKVIWILIGSTGVSRVYKDY